MMRTSATRPELRVGGYRLSALVQHWDSLKHSSRTNGDWELSFRIAFEKNWRHHALVKKSLVELMHGADPLFAGSIGEPNWDDGTMTVIGASREADDALALDVSGNSSTVPNTVIDAAIARGALSWTRVGDFGTTPVGETNGGLVKLRSVLDAWALRNNKVWHVNSRRQLVILQPSEAVPDWLVTPGSGVLGTAGDQQVDVVFVRYIDSATGRRLTASYPAGSPVRPNEQPTDLTKQGAMTTATAVSIAQGIWSELQGRPGWTNRLSLRHGLITNLGGTLADCATVRAPQVVVLRDVVDTRGLSMNTSIVLDEAEYDWDEDDLTATPRGLAARDPEIALTEVGNLAVDAMEAASANRSGNVFPAGTPFVTGAAPPAGTPMLIKTSTVVVAPVDGVGTISFNYAGGAFPNGVVSVVCTPGDDTANFNVIRMRGTSTLATFVGGAITNTGYVGAGSGIRINYIAIGW